MKRHFLRILPVLIMLLSLNSTNITFGGLNEPISRIVVILDAPECYDDFFLQDVLSGFDAINNSFDIDYDVFQLSDYAVTNRTSYQATYNYFNSTSNQTIATNHTQLASTLIESQKYDLIVFIGYELRRLGFKEKPLPELYPETNFLFYDISGDLSPDKNATKRTNVLRVSFLENETGYMAGLLATSTISPLPEKIAAIGIMPYYWLRGEPRSNQLIAGFQAGVFRQNPGVNIDITYIEDFTNYSQAKTLGERLESDGYGVIFAALQNENALGLLDGFSKKIITVDSDRTQISGNKPYGSIAKNNTQTLLTTFEFLNQSAQFPSGDFLFGFSDGVLYPTGWGDATQVNNAMSQIYTDLVVDKVTIPYDIITASNTPGFIFPISIGFFIALALISRKIKS
ncbi:MAG: BMP family ABC transporter substrate-binding protein [Candidatus Hodarchaeales archaeon]|jgi:basic membrane lipoprotein Med (substrate-binding protein (PBP1-ABC) superfamily)